MTAGFPPTHRTALVCTVSISFCCVTNHRITNWCKAPAYLLTILWISTLNQAGLGDLGVAELRCAPLLRWLEAGRPNWLQPRWPVHLPCGPSTFHVCGLASSSGPGQACSHGGWAGFPRRMGKHVKLLQTQARDRLWGTPLAFSHKTRWSWGGEKNRVHLSWELL